MKRQGKIINWNDDKGFGFVESKNSGERAFVHIKAFNNRSRRPVNGDEIIYELVRDNNNRYKAENIKFINEAENSKKLSREKNGITFGEGVTVVFCTWLLVSFFIKQLPLIIFGLYIVMSSITFIAYAIDKSAAQNGYWRTQESTLHLFSLLGGWPGASFAQIKLHHKSRKKEFKVVYWITVLLNLCGLFWLYTEEGKKILNGFIVPLIGG